MQVWPRLTGTGKQLLEGLASGDSDGPDGFSGEELSERLGLAKVPSLSQVSSAGSPAAAPPLGRRLSFHLEGGLAGDDLPPAEARDCRAVRGRSSRMSVTGWRDALARRPALGCECAG